MTERQILATWRAGYPAIIASARHKESPPCDCLLCTAATIYATEQRIEVLAILSSLDDETAYSLTSDELRFVEAERWVQ